MRSRAFTSGTIAGVKRGKQSWGDIKYIGRQGPNASQPNGPISSVYHQKIPVILIPPIRRAYLFILQTDNESQQTMSASPATHVQQWLASGDLQRNFLWFEPYERKCGL